MNISDIISRRIPPEPWIEGEKIPWDEPDFSKRMLKMHLSQDHDAASRRLETVHEQVDYVERLLGDKRGSRVLDLACGPGLHSQELARRGHTASGIDFSPASIEWAKSTMVSESLACEFVQADIRGVDYGTGFDFAMLLFGEMNVRCVLLLEPHEPGVIRANFELGPTWSAMSAGLFSDRPHLLLEEGFWHEDVQMAVKRWYVVDASSGDMTLYSQTMVEYTRDALVQLVESEGFRVSKSASDWPGGDDFYPLVAIAE